MMSANWDLNGTNYGMPPTATREEVTHIETELLFEHIRSADLYSFTDFDIIRG
jgi:hypothetical protein